MPSSSRQPNKEAPQVLVSMSQIPQQLGGTLKETGIMTEAKQAQVTGVAEDKIKSVEEIKKMSADYTDSMVDQMDEKDGALEKKLRDDFGGTIDELLTKWDSIVAVVGGVETNLHIMVKSMAGEAQEQTLKLAPSMKLTAEQQKEQNEKIKLSSQALQTAKAQMKAVRDDIANMKKSITSAATERQSLQASINLLQGKISLLEGVLFGGGVSVKLEVNKEVAEQPPKAAAQPQPKK